jgi:hypothetical protein
MHSSSINACFQCLDSRIPSDALDEFPHFSVDALAFEWHIETLAKVFETAQLDSPSDEPNTNHSR